eukprot:m.75896 g.75896  ORF g.75896 m.75896 type:complete len:394 (+) comp12527_c0_seq3:133-1314(+)
MAELSPVEALVSQSGWAQQNTSDSDKIEVLFTVHSNVAYDGVQDESPPEDGNPLSFQPGDFLQVVQIKNDEWWVARLIGDGPLCGYIPTPSAFIKKLRAMSSYGKKNPYTMEAKSNVPDSSRDADYTDHSPYGKDFLSVKYGAEINRTNKPLERPFPNKHIYDIAPRIRPVLLVGPSRLGCPVTDKMQSALTSYLRIAFADSCKVAKVHKWSIMSKTRMGALRPADIGLEVKHKGDAVIDAEIVYEKEDVEFVKQCGREMKLPIFQVEAEDVNLCRASSLMPIVVHIKVSDTRVFRRVARDVGDNGLHSLPSQIRNCEILNAMKSHNFDLVLSESRLDYCCYELAAFIDVYLAETWFKPVLDPTKLAPQRSDENRSGARRSMFIHGVMGPLDI